MTEQFVDPGLGNPTIAAFDRRHGPYVVIEGWLVYADGATREGTPYGVLQEPSSDPWQRAKKIELYYKVIFDRALRAFDNAKQSYQKTIAANLTMRACGPAPDNDAVGDLQRLRNIAKQAKDNYDKASKAVEAARPEEHKMAERIDQLNRERNQAVLAAISKIEL